MGAGCTTSMPAAPTTNLETTNCASVVAVAWMMVAIMTPRIPITRTFFRPSLSLSHPTIGKATTEPMDCAALTRPSKAPCGLPKYSFHCGRACKPVVCQLVHRTTVQEPRTIHEGSIVASDRRRQQWYKEYEIQTKQMRLLKPVLVGDREDLSKSRANNKSILHIAE